MNDNEIDLDALELIVDKYGLEDAYVTQQTSSRLHAIRASGEDNNDFIGIDNLEYEKAVEIGRLFLALPRLIRYAKAIKEASFYGPFNAEDVEL